MATIDVVLWTHQANRDGTYPLRLRITKNRKTTYNALGYSISQNHWDADRRKVKPNHPNSVRLNNFITTRLSEAQNVALENETKNRHIDVSKIKAKIKGEHSKDFFQFAKVYIERFNNERSRGTYDHMLSVIEKLKRFVNTKTLPFSAINYEFLVNYREHLKGLGNNPNTRTANLKKLRSIYNEAIRKGIMDRNDDPFFKIKMESNRTTKTRLNRIEIDKIRNLDYEKGSIIWHVRNIFLLCYNFMGMRIGDALTLKKDQIMDGRLVYAMRKTDDLISVKLTAEAGRILASYDLELLRPKDFIFPLVKVNKSKDVYSLVKCATALYNQYLRNIAKDAGIEKHISSHVARHSWAQQAKSKNVNIGIIQQAFGHASSRTTEDYMEDFDSNVIDETNEMVVGM